MEPADRIRRQQWRQNRLAMERLLVDKRLRSSADGQRGHPIRRFRVMETLLAAGLKAVGLYRRGMRNALDLRLRSLDITFPHLPPAFDGYTILHLSDLHVDAVAGHMAVLERTVHGLAPDLVAITGDFQTEAQPAPAVVGRRLGPVLGRLTCADGVVAVLGNHDSAAMVEVLESLGVQVLVNERRTITRRGEHLHVVGTDDPYCFCTPAARQALAACGDGFRVALVHTVDLVEEAAAAGYALYLSGHTHGGQVALPGGWPLVTALDRNRHLAVGLWRHGRMVGYTSSGTSSGNLPRFHTRPEATLIRLVRGAADVGSP